MAKIESAIKDAISRGARRHVRAATTPLRRDMRRIRHAMAALRRDLVALRDIAAQWQRMAQSSPWRPEVSDAELEGARLSAGLIQKLRARLGLSQTSLARLVGVSTAAVAQWETSRSEPSDQNRRALVGLRKLGRRDVKRLLASLPGTGAGKTGPRGRRRATRRAAKSRPRKSR